VRPDLVHIHRGARPELELRGTPSSAPAA
jgi:hypothetical protein